MEAAETRPNAQAREMTTDKRRIVFVCVFMWKKRENAR